MHFLARVKEARAPAWRFEAFAVKLEERFSHEDDESSLLSIGRLGLLNAGQKGVNPELLCAETS